MVTGRMARRFIAMSTASMIAAMSFASSANAQLISPCLVLGSPAPPPCIILDKKSLADWIKKHAQEVQKLQQTKQSLEQTVSQIKGIGQQIEGLANFKIDLHLPTIDKIENPFTGVGRDIQSLKGKIGQQFFTGVGGTLDAAAKATKQRSNVSTEAAVDAWASGAAAGKETDRLIKNLAALQDEVSNSKNLRGDWVANSHIKQDLIAARTQNSYLMTAFLKMQAAKNVVNVKFDVPTPTGTGSIAPAHALPAGDSKWDQVRQLDDLYAKAQSLMASLAVVQMTQSIQGTIRSVITDYENTVTRKAAAYQQLTSDAMRWTRKSGHGSYQNTLNVVGTALANMDNQMVALRGQPVESLAPAFGARNIDWSTLVQSEVDPRQFLGTWTDPLKYQNTTNMANDLMKRALSSTIDGNRTSEKEFRNDVYAWNDVRLEEAWKKPYYEEAKQQLVETDAQIVAENQRQGFTVGSDSITQQLKQIVGQANAIGQGISASTDDAAKTAATRTLNDLQGLVNGGTSLPAVDGAPATSSIGAGGPVPLQP